MNATDRRLTTILCADIVGYSGLVARDEAGTLERLAEARAILRAEIEAQGGRVFNLAGDGLLAECPSALAAVRAAVACQQRLADWAAGQPEDRRVRLRIGVNLGDVVVDGDDLLGEGVNTAARLQGLAAPGGICLSAPVHDQVRGRLDVEAVDLGLRAIKNMAEPIRVYALGTAGDPRPAGDPETTGAAGRRGRHPAVERFRLRLLAALLVLAVLLAVNLLTTPHRIWVQWPALGFGLALLAPLLRTLLEDRARPDGGSG